MAERPINLNQARKARDRAAKAARADENAVKFGRTKAERSLEKARADKARRDLDGHARGGSGPDRSGPDGSETR